MLTNNIPPLLFNERWKLINTLKQDEEFRNEVLRALGLAPLMYTTMVHIQSRLEILEDYKLKELAEKAKQEKGL